MSDYGDDDYSDYGEEWFYIEEEYMVADDLAEHVVNSPALVAFEYEEGIPDWDRFDYFNDLEYASDGYDDGNFYLHKSGTPSTGKKRKRAGITENGKKRQKLANGHAASPRELQTVASPVVWRSQMDRDPKPKFLDDTAEPYALLKDWRERLKDTPAWLLRSPHPKTPESEPSDVGKGKAAQVEPLSPIIKPDSADEAEEDGGMDPSVLMAVLQKNLSAAGGPLSGMDPQQLLQFAMRMMSNEDASDDIAGELAEDMLNQGEDDEEDGEAPKDLLSWLSKQRNPNQDEVTSSGSTSTRQPAPPSPEAKYKDKRPPTPPSSEANRSVRAQEDEKEPRADDARVSNDPMQGPLRKRKAGDDADGTATKKRDTRSFDAPTAASQGKAIPTTRSTRSRAKHS